MIKAFSSVITKCKDIANKFRGVDATANGVETNGRQLVQQWGFISVPTPGSKVIFIQIDNAVYGIASDSSDRPSVEEGETALYTSKDHFIIIHKDGTISIKANGGIDVDGDIRVSGKITATGNVESDGDVKDSVGALSRLRQNYNSHTHVGNLGAPTATPQPMDQ